MLKSHEQFHAANGKREILIVDDQELNLELLGEILKDEYEILKAGNGQEAMEMMKEHQDSLSLVLLDIVMPVMTGLEVLEAKRNDPDIAGIPVIVLTSEQEYELQCLKLGAVDFIPKPYPAQDVARARVARIIELAEDRQIIQSTERDTLTGLYNREYFYQYAQQYDQHHRDKRMDAIIVDINHFHILNERYGKAYGDEVLKRVAGRIKEIIQADGGIVCRRQADTFMVYTPHREDYKQIMDELKKDTTDPEGSGKRVRVRVGVYTDVDKSIDIERRFDRAKLAADNIKGNLTQNLAFYDNETHERQIYEEQLIDDFYAAIDEKQFIVYYQPKYDVTGDHPVLSSAEALVRWIHPERGMINPGVFIPLFEDNGLIQTLDRYVWREVCIQIRDWKDRLGIHVPVSVNVSRIDLYDPGLVSTLQNLVKEYENSYRDLMLEVTESAYTQDTEQIIEVVERLRKLGFRIEMDDFGTGYSSLNMVSSLPFDVLKLDMKFVRNAFREDGDIRMLELIIDIAEYLKVPVVAEGVEDEIQLNRLKEMGCDLIQGFYFSRPVPAEDFEEFLMERKENRVVRVGENLKRKNAETDQQIAMAEFPEEEDAEGTEMLLSEILDRSEEKTAGAEDTAGTETAHTSGIQLRTATVFFVILAVLAALSLTFADLSVARGYQRMEQASDRYLAAQFAASDLESGSDYLTDRVRCFVVTGDQGYLNDFIEEVNVNKTRDKAVEDLETLIGASDSEALASLNKALKLSNDLVNTEYLAMRLELDTGDYDMDRIPEEIASIKLSAEDKALSSDEKTEKAQELVFDNDYMHAKDRIRENVGRCTESLIRTSSQELEEASARMSFWVSIQTAMTVLFLVIVLAIAFFIYHQIRRPLTSMVRKMQAQEDIVPSGAEELRFVSETYNSILKENKYAHDRLRHEASHDALTGLLNRGAYELMMDTVDTSHIAMILVDVDYFKMVNDRYGHVVGDRVLKRVAEILKTSFRSVDIICRIGGDEFVVIMTRVNSTMTQLVRDKIQLINQTLQHPKDDLPPISLSVGVAFSDRENPQGDIFRDADTALYRVKEAGRNGCEIY